MRPAEVCGSGILVVEGPYGSAKPRRPPPLPRRGSPLAFASGAAAIGLGVLARLPLDALAGAPLPPYITFFPVIVIAGLLGGMTVALLAVAIFVVLALLFWTSPYAGEATVALITTTTFAASGSIVAILSGWARTLYDGALSAEAERGAAARETIHRIKNLIAVVLGISRNVATAASVPEYRDSLEQRLLALSAAQDVLLRRSWEDVELDQLVSATLKPFLSDSKLHVEEGALISVPGRVVSSMTLALYELATNAVKYGALGPGAGSVLLSWRIDAGRCRLEWRESGAGKPVGRVGDGLGSALVGAALGGLEGANVRHTITADGVHCVFEWPTESSGSRAD